ncbi:hypothetical protein [Halorussus marinus]|uniref:hypothetical protein n=1 Tax=Halorussus marinus TaxID=2505976 RepID=UPI00106E49DE|nr:hypothetical protein [Halorussus marinus]
MDPEDLRERLEARLMSHGVYVTSLERTDAGLALDYETATPGEAVPDREIGRVLNLLLDALADGEWEPVDVRATVHDIDDPEPSADGEPDPAAGVRGSWRADAEWLAAHDDGDISDVELSQRVLDTVEEA